MQRRESTRRHFPAGLVLALAAVVAISAMVLYHKAGASGVKEARPVAHLDAGGFRDKAPADGWLSFRGGHLHYGHDQQGNRIPDFSYAGYEGGGVPLPVVPARVTLSAPAGDATAMIQQAIDQVSAMPLDAGGFRGAVVLSPGTYQIGTSLHIRASGVVLRGGTSNPADTVLLPQNHVARTLVSIGGTGTITAAGPAHAVTDSYIPVGESTLTLDRTTDLAVGDDVIVQRPQTQAWIHAIGMDAIPPRPDGKPITQWPPNAGLLFERKIVAIHGPHVVLDVPLTNALEQQFTNATVWKYTFPGRISQVGLENLSSDGIAMAAAPGFANGGFFNATFVDLNAVENAWVQNTVVTRYTQPYQVGTGAIRVTIQHTQSLHMEQAMPQSVPDQPFTYGVSGQLVLVRDAVVTGSNVHAWTTQSRVPGPNVFSGFVETNTGNRKFDSGPHQRWASGVLGEDLTMQSTPGADWAATELEDRQWFGSGQGWAAGNSMLYNVTSTTWRVEDPPTAHNWAIGVIGTSIAPHPNPPHVNGEFISIGQLVLPSSLYDEQLSERLPSHRST